VNAAVAHLRNDLNFTLSPGPTGVCAHQYLDGPPQGCISVDGGGACAGFIGSVFDYLNIRFVPAGALQFDGGCTGCSSAAFLLAPGGNPANNGQQPLLTPNQQKALHCLGQTVKAKGLSIGLDVAGAIPGFGNLFSGAAAGIQGLNAAYYGTVSLANAGNTLLNPSASGAANTAATAGFAVASLAASGSKAIPVIGTIVSLGFLA
jgi:hypothetical protein